MVMGRLEGGYRKTKVGKLKKAGIPLYANTAALAPHIKRFVFDHTYYSVFWTMMSQKDKD